MIGRRGLLGGSFFVSLASVMRVANAQTSLHARLRNRPLLCAHRGWLDPSRTENSLDQMRITTSAGPFMVEMDLALDASGTIILMHDETVERSTKGKGAVRDMNDAAIKHLALRSAMSVSNESPPHYSAVIDWASRTSSALLMLDIKKVPPSLALAPLQAAGMTDRAVILTFDPTTAQAAFLADEKIMVSVLIKDFSDILHYQEMAHGRNFVAYIPASAQLALFEAAHQSGAIVLTDILGPDAVSDALPPERVAGFVRQRFVDILVTNEPQLVFKALHAA